MTQASGGKRTGTWGWDQTGPVWGARAFAPKSGQDHLGLGSVSSDRILPSLSPGINVLTIHPRYWSFYSWVLDDFWATKLPRTRQAFRDFYRPREALFAMACHVCDAPEHATLVANIVGSRRVGGLSKNEDFDPQFDYIKEGLGGYGLYYRSAMESTGVLVIAGSTNGFPFDAPLPAGRALAAAFRAAVSRTALAKSLDEGEVTKPVPRQALLEFARVACLCQLRVATEYDLPLLQDLFLHSGEQHEVASRKETMRLVLDISSCSPSEPITQDAFRQLVYFRQLEGSTFAPRADLLDAARRWRVYQGREYFSFVFNRLLQWLVKRGLADTDGGLTVMPPGRLSALIAEALDSVSEAPSQSPDLLLVTANTRATDFADSLANGMDLDKTADEAWPRAPGLDEHALYRLCRELVAEDDRTLVALLALILLLRERFGLPARTDELLGEQALLAEGGAQRNGMARFMHQLNQRLLRQPTLAGLAQWLIEDFVIVQHERVAIAKLPDDTFRVRRVGEGLRFFSQDTPASFNDSRFGALSTMVHELGWVSTLREPQRELTPTGRRLLDDGDLSPGALSTASASYDPSGIGSL